MKKYMLAATITVASLLGLYSLPALSHEAGDWILRVGAATVEPDDSSSVISTGVTGPLPNTGVEVKNDTQVGINVVYMWSDNLGLELLAATPFDHDIRAEGLPAPYDVVDLGSAKHLPPTLTANYFFLDSQSEIRPYLGIGLNYTRFFSEDFTSAAESKLGASGLSVDDSWGIAWRAGIDWELSDTWMLNASAWKIDLDTDASFDSGLDEVKVGVDVDPWVYMISLGYKF